MDGKPLILAPAGNRESFLAAIAAGTDAIYCGLKRFSARMEAKNFETASLAGLIRFAHQKKVEVYIAINTQIKDSEMAEAKHLLSALVNRWCPDALIVQDIGLIGLAEAAGYCGEVHLSTLANCSFPTALASARGLGNVKRVVLPRELSVDEIKRLSSICPRDLDLEVFVHGALCYGVSGRCYWSSYMGGKSGLRGRCVQPCRRVYTTGNENNRLFSCQDLSLDTLVKVLKEVPKVTTWKIEGRKKSPHYVYYTVQAYRMLRDEFQNPDSKKSALALLEMALGRQGTHYNFLPQRPRNPLEQGRDTGSGFQVGTVKGPSGKSFFSPKIDLLKGDALRVGCEDQPWHAVIHVRKFIPRNGRFFINIQSNRAPQKGTPVFLIDRREPALSERIAELANELEAFESPDLGKSNTRPTTQPNPSKNVKLDIKISSYDVLRLWPTSPVKNPVGIWLSEESLRHLNPNIAGKVWVWLPPVIWPDDEERVVKQIGAALESGAKQFVLNAPWQNAFFEGKHGVSIWAGPFCNIANHAAVTVLKGMGFSGAFISPELGREDVLGLPEKSCLPLGIVVGGNWPLCISRIAPESLAPGAPFYSPKGEGAWLAKDESNYWVFPNWAIDLTHEIDDLRRAGYRMMVTLKEPIPKQVKMKDRPGLWNWKHGLL